MFHYGKRADGFQQINSGMWGRQVDNGKLERARGGGVCRKRMFAAGEKGNCNNIPAFEEKPGSIRANMTVGGGWNRRANRPPRVVV